MQVARIIKDMGDTFEVNTEGYFNVNALQLLHQNSGRTKAACRVEDEWSGKHYLVRMLDNLPDTSRELRFLGRLQDCPFIVHLQFCS